MAIMTDQDRVDVWADTMRVPEQTGVWASDILKTTIRAAVDAADQWVSNNQASYNTALPVTFRANATQAQKALVLVLVLTRRFIKGVV